MSTIFATGFKWQLAAPPKPEMLEHAAPVRIDFAPGDATGIAIPAHAEALRGVAETFLTGAFRHYGTLSPDNRVVRIRHFESFPGGNSGHKLLLSLDYARDEPGLSGELFVKFSRDFADAFRDRRRRELQAEVHLAELSRLPAFPVKVPAAYFADFHAQSGTGILITERIAFGSDGIEPLRPKCMDHQLADPFAYYRALVTALARLAAAHISGRLAPQVDALFPYDPQTAVTVTRIPWSEAELRERVARYAAFAANHPQLLPANITTPKFIAQLETDAVRLLHHQTTVARYLGTDPELIALCHQNTNIDNAWFWREPSGALQCGLLDWGMVRQMNIGCALWGGLCGADISLWNSRLDELLGVFVGELHANGGPQLDIERLRLHLELSAAMLGLTLMMDVPALVLARLPEIVEARGPLDPILQKSEVARSFLHVFSVFLNLWQTRDFGATLELLLAAQPVTRLSQDIS